MAEISPRFRFSPQLLTSFDTIDQQHSAIFDFLNKFSAVYLESSEKSSFKDEITALFPQLREATVTHFGSEENLFLQYLDKSRYAKHKKIHDEFVALIDKAKDDWLKEKTPDERSLECDTLLNFIYEWCALLILWLAFFLIFFLLRFSSML